MENLNFDLKEGQIVSVNLILQTMKESNKYVVASMLDIESINSKKRKFEVSINSNTINYEQFKIFFDKSNSGNSELSFKIFHTQTPGVTTFDIR